jgi:DNA-binding LytR/AlgR family response regulator
VESVKDYIKVVTKEKTVITKEQLSNFSNQLPAHDFIRVHRSFLVAKKNIDAYSSSIIEIGGKEISIGRNYKEACMVKLSSQSNNEPKS